MVMAAVGLVVLIGSLVFFFQQAQKDHQASMLPLRPGWKEIASFSGTGSKVLTGQPITLPHLWGATISCVGHKSLDIDLEGTGKTLRMSKRPCSTPSPTPSSPQSIEYDLDALTIEMLSITAADSTTTWSIEFVQEEQWSHLRPGPGWTGIMGVGSTGGSALGVLSNVAPRSLWGLVGICLGGKESTISAQLTPPPPQQITFHCDGMPRLFVVHYPSPMAVQDVEITSSEKDMLFSIYVVACTNGQQCSSVLSIAYSGDRKD